MRSPWLRFSAILSLVASISLAHGPYLRTRADAPPPPPIPAPFASRGAIFKSPQRKRVAQDTTTANQETVALPLSPGITLISMPVRTDSLLLSDLLPNLPDGS